MNRPDPIDPGPTAALPGWGSGGRPPGRHSMEKLVELGAKVELPGKLLG
ncbi:hypothetical protein [Streptomyces antibioticus]